MRFRRFSVGAVLALVIALATIGSVAPALAVDDPVYYLPAPEGTTLVVARGNGDTTGRTPQQQFAYTFIAAEAPQRFPVLAARGGTVISARFNVKGGRCSEPLEGPRPRCWRDVNYVLIDQADGTSALYMHLKRGRPAVRRGDVVSAGQRIGTAGTSGWTDQTGLGFQVQETPSWNDVGRGGWFLTPSMPVAFADADVVAQRPDGVPQADDTVTSSNPGASFEPFRFGPRPAGLPANVPLSSGTEVELSSAYQAGSSDGYGLSFAAPVAAATDTIEPGFIPGPEVRPLFGGELAFAGCASGQSASLGRIVATSLEIAGTPYLALHGHLSWVAPNLLDLDPALPAPIVGAADIIGHYGLGRPSPEDQTLDCPQADPGRTDLFVSILRDGVISAEGEIIAGTPVSPEPLVGALGYEGFAWWKGPLTGLEVAAEPGRPRARWNARTPASGSHITFGDTVRLVARVRDVADIAQVRFRAYYPRWPQIAGSSGLISFDPRTSWRELAVCTAPAGRQSGLGGLCDWNGDARDAKVTYVWDPRSRNRSPVPPGCPGRSAPSRAAAASVCRCRWPSRSSTTPATCTRGWAVCHCRRRVTARQTDRPSVRACCTSTRSSRPALRHRVARSRPVAGRPVAGPIRWAALSPGAIARTTRMASTSTRAASGSRPTVPSSSARGARWRRWRRTRSAIGRVTRRC